jgi:GST-like protein
MEAKRQLDVLNRRLSESAYLAGDSYTIADIAVWSWYGQVVRNTVYGAAEFLAAHEYTHVQRWAETIAQRPAVIRGMRVNRTWGDEATQVPERHNASDLD